MDKEVAVLLEAWHETNVSGEFTYEWYKNKSNLQKVHFPIYCLKVSNISAEGEYECVRTSSTNNATKSVSLHITTPLDGLKHVFVERYRGELSYDACEWPVIEQNTFIKLAIHKSDHIPKKKNRHTTIIGDADNEFPHNCSTDYVSTFESLSYGDRVLVEGRPGSGKTTLVHKMSHDWANGVLRWGNLRLLFVVHLRGFQNNPDITLGISLLVILNLRLTLRLSQNLLISTKVWV